MGVIFRKLVKGRWLSKIERSMVNAMKEEVQAERVLTSMRDFNNILMMLPKIDKTFEALRDTFKRFDENANGTLELKELKDCFGELQVSFTDEEVKDLYAESDMNANSGIDKVLQHYDARQMLVVTVVEATNNAPVPYLFIISMLPYVKSGDDPFCGGGALLSSPVMTPFAGVENFLALYRPHYYSH
ncbi:hypothetical protein L7F22_007346 [Adiantum nelumboides]|nr:hypothetical protein [Adiantum nelumboides]